MGFEPMMRVLQTLALPLGDVAAGQIIRESLCFVNRAESYPQGLNKVENCHVERSEASLMLA
jgi:hypothetical protein